MKLLKHRLSGARNPSRAVFITENGDVVRRCCVCKILKPNNAEYYRPCKHAKIKTIGRFYSSCIICYNEGRKKKNLNKRLRKIEDSLIFIEGIGELKFYDLSKKTSYVNNFGVIYRKCSTCLLIKHEADNFGYVTKTSKDKLRKYRTRGFLCHDCSSILRRKRREKLKESGILDSLEYKEKSRKQHRIKKKKRLLNDPAYKLRELVSNAVNKAFKAKSLNKGGSILNYLPNSIIEMKLHIENQFDENMSWENHGKYWHVDHIIPQSDLPYTSMEDENFKICWGLDNLRPLEARQNILDGVHRIRHKKQ